ncbi:MAG: UDP-N-acetylmuramoyl-L-alanine--D-glutamate ligase [Clostridiaceae bacterium]|nr:UDP-N-acetylmuramoyl-L-alanine--D-glutamate ligase [Clostridiaceae bacterium]
MQIKGKRVLVIGAAVTGVPVVLQLSHMGADIVLNDFKKVEELKEVIAEIEELPIKLVAGGHPAKLAEDCDFVVVSPGIPTDIPLIQNAKSLGKEVISEIELAFRLTKTPIAAITGTNGKTTTTSLLGEIMRASGIKTFVAGNIGNAMILDIDKAKPSDIFALEVSSFQLESTVSFKPSISAILNITPDHLNRHKTIKNYIDAKCKVFINQDDKDYTILNLDDLLTSKLIEMPKSKVLLFSRKQEVPQGAFLENNYIVIRVGRKKETIIHKDEIYIPGNHNLENALAAALMAYCAGVPASVIADTLKSFKGVEHRIEYVEEIDGVIYYNDSKGTNTDASIKAVEAMKRPTLIIAGGYDKGSEYDDFIESFGNVVKHMILIGSTADKLEETAHKHGFMNTYKAKDLKEAVMKCHSLANPGECVLLSPACASWGMFSNYEERGRLFKEYVKELQTLDTRHETRDSGKSL